MNETAGPTLKEAWNFAYCLISYGVGATLETTFRDRNRFHLAKWLSGFRAFGLLVAGAIAIGWCSGCQYAAHWPEQVTRGLAWAGVVASALGIVGAWDRLRAMYWPDGVLCLTLLAGFWILAGAGSAGVQMCGFCALYWTTQLPLWLELVPRLCCSWRLRQRLAGTWRELCRLQSPDNLGRSLARSSRQASYRRQVGSLSFLLNVPLAHNSDFKRELKHSVRIIQ